MLGVMSEEIFDDDGYEDFEDFKRDFEIYGWTATKGEKGFVKCYCDRCSERFQKK